jgi:hypothetical protein
MTKQRSRIFLLEQLDADIDKAATTMIKLKIGNSKMLLDNPEPWRQTTHGTVSHLLRKIPLYFDKLPSSKPDQSQSVVPVTTLLTTRAKCRSGTCAPIVAQGYSDTLCSLSVLTFAAQPLTDGTNLIPKTALLNAMIQLIDIFS